MLPRWHIFLGAAVSLILLIALPKLNLVYIGLFFLASFLIDFDHYMAGAINTKKFGLFESFRYHAQKGLEQAKERSRGIKRKGDFHVFHTLEFHLFVLALSFVYMGFLFIFLGMLFHSSLDIFDMSRKGYFYRREYFLTNWIISKRN